MQWNEWWSNYQDWKYPVTVVLCLGVGRIWGWKAHKEKCERENRL